MDAHASSRRSRLLHRVFRVRLKDEPSVEPPRSRVLVLQAIWFALVGAWLELATILVQRGIVGNVTRVSHRMNWYHAQLGVMAHLILIAPWLVASLLLARKRPDCPKLALVLVRLGLFLSLVSAFLALEELHWAGSLVLALGFAIRLGPLWNRHQSTILRLSLPPLVLFSGLLAIGGFAWLRSSEARHLSALPVAKPELPNFVLVVMDTVRADHLSLHGFERATSPEIEKLAQRSIVFDFARAPAPWTLPSHSTMFTGRWPHELSADIDRRLDSTYPTIAEFLSRNGYKTGGFTGNTFYTNAWFGIDRGFAHYEDMVENQEISLRETLRSAAVFRRLMPLLAKRLGFFRSTGAEARRKSAEEVRQDAIRWLDARNDGHPFFLFVNQFDAHDPYEIPPGHHPQFSAHSKDEILRANRLYFQKSASTDAGGDSPTKIVMDAYDDAILYMDSQIGKLVEDIEKRSGGRETWIVITSDHGEFFGEHGQQAHGSSLYRPAIDVPLVIVPPRGQGRAARISTPVSPRDLPATLADLAGLESPPFPGHSLRRFWDGSSHENPVEPPISEMKLPPEHFAGKKVSDKERFNTSTVSDERVLYRNRSTPDESYRTSDRSEKENLAGKPEEAERLLRFRAYLDRLIQSP